MKKLLILAAAACLCWGQAAAQEERPEWPVPPDSAQGPHPRFAEVPNPEKAARAETDRLKEELQLTEKQYKKVYKLNLKAQKERLEARFPAMGEGRPMPPMGGGRPPMGGSRPPMPEGGFPPMMGQGFPPMPQENPEERAERMKKQAQKREKKMKKILTEEQFARWKELQARPPHPVPPEAERPAD